LGHDGVGGHRRRVPFRGHQVPAVPLEIQLETNLRRGFQQRVTEIIALFQRHEYDMALVEKALSECHLDRFEQLMAQHHH
jgi:hypothetical protein